MHVDKHEHYELSAQESEALRDRPEKRYAFKPRVKSNMDLPYERAAQGTVPRIFANDSSASPPIPPSRPPAPTPTHRHTAIISTLLCVGEP